MEGTTCSFWRRKMKKNKFSVAVVNRYFYPVTAGVETNLLEIYPHLKTRGWDVSVHVTNNTLDSKNILKKKDRIKGIKVNRYKTSILGFFPKISWNSVDLVSIQNFTISPHIYILSYALILKLLRKKKFALVLSTHGGFTPDWSTFSPTQRIIKRFYHNTFGLFLINNVVDGIRAVSEWEKNELITVGVKSSLIKVIGNGIEEEAFLPLEERISSQTKRAVAKYGEYILEIARIHKIKNIETTIKALRYLSTDITYVVLGQIEDKQYFAQLQQLVKKLKLEKRVVFAGTMRGFDKYYLIRKSRLFVHMARWEAYANVIIESMSQKKVCIVSDIPALAPVIAEGKNGTRVPTTDHKRLAKTISFYLNKRNEGRIKIIGENNYEFSKNQSWSKIVSTIEKYYIESVESVQHKEVSRRALATRAMTFLSHKTSIMFGIRMLTHPVLHTHIR